MQGAGIINIPGISGSVPGTREIWTESRKPHNYAAFRLSFHFCHMIFRLIFTEFRRRYSFAHLFTFLTVEPWGKRQLARIPWGKSI